MAAAPPSLAGLAERWPRWTFTEVVVRDRGKPPCIIYRARCGTLAHTARSVDRLAGRLLAEELWQPGPAVKG